MMKTQLVLVLYLMFSGHLVVAGPDFSNFYRELGLSMTPGWYTDSQTGRDYYGMKSKTVSHPMGYKYVTQKNSLNSKRGHGVLFKDEKAGAVVMVTSQGLESSSPYVRVLSHKEEKGGQLKASTLVQQGDHSDVVQCRGSKKAKRWECTSVNRGLCQSLLGSRLFKRVMDGQLEPSEEQKYGYIYDQLIAPHFRNRSGAQMNNSLVYMREHFFQEQKLEGRGNEFVMVGAQLVRPGSPMRVDSKRPRLSLKKMNDQVDPATLFETRRSYLTDMGHLCRKTYPQIAEHYRAQSTGTSEATEPSTEQAR